MTGAHQPIVVSEGMADHLKSSFAIIRFNSRTYESGGVMAVVNAYTAAEYLMRDYEFGQCEEDSIQRLALFPRRNRSGSWHER